MMRVNWVALSIGSCPPRQPPRSRSWDRHGGGGREGEGSEAEAGSFGGRQKNKGDKQSSRSGPEMSGSYADDKLNFAVI